MDRLLDDIQTVTKALIARNIHRYYRLEIFKFDTRHNWESERSRVLWSFSSPQTTLSMLLTVCSGELSFLLSTRRETN